MSDRECRLFIFRFFTLAVFCGSLLTFSACSGAKNAHLKRGEEFLQKRKFHEAAMQFRAAADIDKNSADAHWGLSRAYENLGQFNETIDELRKTVENAPDNLDARAKLGNYFLLVQPPMLGEAEKMLGEIFARNPDFIEGHVLKASILAVQKKSEPEIVGVLNQAIALDPNRTASYIALARYYMTLNKAAEAEAAIKKGISVSPNASTGYIEYGRFLTYTDRGAEAEEQFNKAVAVESGSIEAREELAEFYLIQNQPDKAEQAFKQLVAVQENSPESRLQLADFYARIGRDDEAVQTLNDILRDAPEYVRARYRLGEIKLESRSYDDVLTQTETLLAANDDDAEALMLRARVYLARSEAEKAVADLEEILKKQPTQKDALFYMTQARLALGQTSQAQAFIGDLEKYHAAFLKTGLLKIQLAFAAEDYAAAFRQSNELYETVKNTFPNAENDARELMDLRVRSLSARGLASLELGKINEARADLQEIVRVSPRSSAALVNLAKTFVAEKKYGEAAGLYNRALAADKTNFDAVSGAVNILTAQKQTAAARELIDKTLRENQGKSDVAAGLHYLQANVYAAEQNQTAADEELKKAMAADENYLPAYSAYAAALAARSEIGAAIEQYQNIVSRKPSASIYTLLGILEDGRGNHAEAEKNYRKALEISPESPIAANNLAWNLAENGGNLDEALTLAQKSVNRTQAAGFHDTLGWIYFKKGLFLPAVEQMKKAVALDAAEAQRGGATPNPAYRLRLGTALASAGDKPSARREVETSLQNEENLSRKDAQDARNLLAAL